MQRKAPMTADEVRAYIAQMERDTRSRAARIKLAETAIKFGNVTDDGKDVYRAYVSELRGV